MTIMQLTYFVDAAELHSLTKVAELHHVSQPAVSSAIRDLEKEFKITLFDRRGKDLILTESGRNAYTRSKELIRHYLDTYQQFTQEGNKRNSFRIGIAKNVAAVHLCDIYSYIQKVKPAFTVNASERTISDMINMVRHGGLDMACFAYSAALDAPELSVVQVSVLRLQLCVRKDLFYSEQDELSLPDVKDIPLTVQEASSLHNTLVRNIYSAAGMQANIKYEISQVYTQHKLVEKGLSAAVMPPELFQGYSDVKCYALREIEPIPVYLAYRRGDNIQPLVQLMKAYFRN